MDEQRINLTPKEVPCYDGERNDKLHRVVETTKSRTYDKLSRPKLYSISTNLDYSGRVITEPASEADYL